MRALLAEIRDGRFAERLKTDAGAGFPGLHRHRSETADHGIESAGRAVRDLMPWLAEDDAKSEASGSLVNHRGTEEETEEGMAEDGS